MGFDIQRFIDKNIDPEFICNICQDVLEEPLMISKCQHFYCSKCILDCIKAQGVCPRDRSSVALNKLVEPIRFVKNMLNKLNIKCEFNECQQVLNLGELNNHMNKCEANPENKKIVCFCRKDFTFSEYNCHKDLCLEYQKNELEIVKRQSFTYSMSVLELCENQTEKVASDSRIKFLFNQLKQNLSKSGEDANCIQKSLIFISSKLLIDENDIQKVLLSSTLGFVANGFEDISLATDRNYDYCCDLISNNGIEYMIFGNSLFNNKYINQYIAQIVESITEFEDLIVGFMNKKSIKMLLNIMHESNFIDAFVDSATALSNITHMGPDFWQQHATDVSRQEMLSTFRTRLLSWSSSHSYEPNIESLDELFNKIKSVNSTPEITEFYVWFLTVMTRTNPQKYIPMIESENGFEYLQTLSDFSRTQSQMKTNIEYMLNKWIEWKQVTENSQQIV